MKKNQDFFLINTQKDDSRKYTINKTPLCSRTAGPLIHKYFLKFLIQSKPEDYAYYQYRCGTEYIPHGS